MLFLFELKLNILAQHYDFSYQIFGESRDVKGNGQSEDRVVAGGKGGSGGDAPVCGLSVLRPMRGLLGGTFGGEGGATNPVATSGNEVIAVDWKGLKDVDQINMDSTSSLHGSSLHRPSTEVRPPAQLPPHQRTSQRPQEPS